MFCTSGNHLEEKQNYWLQHCVHVKPPIKYVKDGLSIILVITIHIVIMDHDFFKCMLYSCLDDSGGTRGSGEHILPKHTSTAPPLLNIKVLLFWKFWTNLAAFIKLYNEQEKHSYLMVSPISKLKYIPITHFFSSLSLAASMCLMHRFWKVASSMESCLLWNSSMSMNLRRLEHKTTSLRDLEAT